MPEPKPDRAIAPRILTEAVRLFARKGYAAATTREIVDAAGVTKPMLYYYYQSKEGVARAALAHVLDPFHARLSAALDATLAPIDRLTEVVWAHLAFCRDNPDFARFFYAVYFGPDEQSADLDVNRYTLRGHELVARAAGQAVADGLARPGTADALTLALHGMITIRVMAAIKGGIDLTRDLARVLVDELLTGFGQPGPARPGKKGAPK